MLPEAGYQIHRQVIPAGDLGDLREAADALASAAGSACVRGIRARSAVVDALSTSPALLALLPPDFVPVRSILFDKTPAENWPVAWHQDLTIAVRDRRDVPGYGPWSVKDEATHAHAPASLLGGMITLRIHLDATGSENGALAVIPESHRYGKIPTDRISGYTAAIELCECEAGDVLAMSPLLLHSSRRSADPARRRILHFEYAARDALHPALEWHEAARRPLTCCPGEVRG